MVGLFGYTIVDTAIEARVSDLENRVAYLESVIEEQGVTVKPATTVPATVPTTKPSVTLPAVGGEVVDSGYCGDYTTWTLYSDGKLVISGKGAIYDATPAWGNYRNQIKTVVIEDGVTNVSDHAFNSCSNLTSVTIPDSVTSIGGSVFSDCTSLESVTIGNGVKTISEKCFYNCTSLKTVTIGKSVTEIGEMAFAGCTSLTDVYYAGTQEQWNAITIGDSNARLTDAKFHYNHKA